MLKRHSVAAAGTTVLFTMAATIGVASAASSSVLDLELNESGPGATTAVDAGGMRHHGAIGSHVQMNGQYANFDRHNPSERIANG